MFWLYSFPVVLAVFAWAYLRASRSRQRLSEEQAAVVRSLPERRRGQHHLDVTLSDGREVKGVYIAYGQFVVPGLLPWRRVRAAEITDFRPRT